MKNNRNEYVIIEKCLWKIWEENKKPLSFYNTWTIISTNTIVNDDWIVFIYFTIYNWTKEMD